MRIRDLNVVSEENNMNSAAIYKNAYQALSKSVANIYLELLERLPLIIAGFVFLIITWLVAKIAYKIIGKICIKMLYFSFSHTLTISPFKF